MDKEYEITPHDIEKTRHYLETLGYEEVTETEATNYLLLKLEKFRELGRVLTDEELEELQQKFASQKSD